MREDMRKNDNAKNRKGMHRPGETTDRAKRRNADDAGETPTRKMHTGKFRPCG